MVLMTLWETILFAHIRSIIYFLESSLTVASFVFPLEFCFLCNIFFVLTVLMRAMIHVVLNCLKRDLIKGVSMQTEIHPFGNKEYIISNAISSRESVSCRVNLL